MNAPAPLHPAAAASLLVMGICGVVFAVWLLARPATPKRVTAIEYVPAIAEITPAKDESRVAPPPPPVTVQLPVPRPRPKIEEKAAWTKADKNSEFCQYVRWAKDNLPADVIEQYRASASPETIKRAMRCFS